MTGILLSFAQPIERGLERIVDWGVEIAFPCLFHGYGGLNTDAHELCAVCAHIMLGADVGR